jgi:hypothetical protein
MGKILKLFTASVLTVCLSVATVLCCCSASATMAHFHKMAMCGHCSDKNSHHNSSNPDTTCQYQLTSAELSNSQVVSSSVVSGVSFPSLVSFDKQLTISLSPPILAYPPGSPPLGISFIPLYLRTFNLRI